MIANIIKQLKQVCICYNELKASSVIFSLYLKRFYIEVEQKKASEVTKNMKILELPWMRKVLLKTQATACRVSYIPNHLPPLFLPLHPNFTYLFAPKELLS